MADRFFLEEPVGDRSTAELHEAEAHHLSKVMRIREGETIVAFDGTGCEFRARVAKISKHSVALEIMERCETDREEPRSLTLAVALPKGERQRYLVEKCVELGVTRLIPLETRRGVAQGTESAVERLRRYVIEATKQCGRTRLMAISPPSAFERLIELEEFARDRRLIAHPTGDMWPSEKGDARSTIVAIGPEGGFTDDEIEFARRCEWSSVKLGPRILRVETAAAWCAVRNACETE